MQAHLSFKDASIHVKTGTNGEPQSREGGSFGKGTEGIQLGGVTYEKWYPNDFIS